MLRRYDLASEVASSLRWEILAMNIGDVGAFAAANKQGLLVEALSCLVDRVMETRPGLDRVKVEEMVRDFWCTYN